MMLPWFVFRFGDERGRRRAGRISPGLLLVILGLAGAGGAGGWWWRSTSGSAGQAWVTKAHDGPAWFEEVAKQAGLDFVHVRCSEVRYWLPEIMSGGAALFDYDNDGDLDLYLVQAGDLDPSGSDKPGNRLYRNRGDGWFEDVTAAAGVGDTGYGIGCTCGDYDGDGDIDLYVTNVGPNVLYRNNADGSFTDVTRSAGVGDPGWGTSTAFIDYDGDGDLDLFVVNYILWSIETDLRCTSVSGVRGYCKPGNYDAPAPDTLYRNEGDGTFVEVSEAAGLRAAFGNGLGLCYGDYNLDGRMDLYVANDGDPNQLWLNTGEGGFKDEALFAGCSVNVEGATEAGMGVASVDIDNDGDLDLFMTHLRNETNTLYLNHGDFFEDVTALTGLSSTSVAYTGFGMGFADFNHDGELDLYIANGKVGRTKPEWDDGDPYGEPNQLLKGRGDMRFDEVVPTGGTAAPMIGTSRAAAFGDLDNDGDIDIVVLESGGAVRLLRNLSGSRGAWIMFRVVDRRGLDALGSMVSIEAGGRRQFRPVQTAYSYCASSDPRVHFGLGGVEGVEDVRVRWPSGREETFGALPARQVHELREGTGKPVALN